MHTRPSYLAGKGEEHQIQKNQTYTTTHAYFDTFKNMHKYVSAYFTSLNTHNQYTHVLKG